jgi:hypothetical protein
MLDIHEPGDCTLIFGHIIGEPCRFGARISPTPGAAPVVVVFGAALPQHDSITRNSVVVDLPKHVCNDLQSPLTSHPASIGFLPAA